MKRSILFVFVLALVSTLALTAPIAVAKDMTAKELVAEAKKKYL
jgi:hypothetical protein